MRVSRHVRRTPPVAAMLLLGAVLSLHAGQDEPPEAGYVLGAGDEVSVRVVDVDEFRDEALRIDSAGYLNLPLIGRVLASGLTVRALERKVAEALNPYVRAASVIIAVKAFHSQPVSVIGAVNRPGVYQLQGRKTLLEVLSLAEGLRSDAGNAIRITRTRGGAGADRPTVFQVQIKALLDGLAPEQNVPISAGDVISVPRAEMVYVMGSVRRSGGFVLGERDQLSVLQALALAEGLEAGAAPNRGRIIRGLNGARTEITVDVRKILEGKSEDLRLEANDILFVPSSAAKKATLRGIEAAIQLATGIAIWRR